MILLLNRLGVYHHISDRHMSEASLVSLQTFRSQVTGNLHQVLESLKLGSDFLSFIWIHKCLKMLPIFNKAFAMLMTEIDYPVSNWEAGSIEEYLDYTINLLELLNSINSSLSYLNQARVSVSHALSLMESSPAMAVERIREITVNDSVKGFDVSRGDEERNRKGKERIFHEAMVILRSTGFWVCGAVLSGLRIDATAVMEIMKSEVLVDCSLMPLDSIFRKKINEKKGLVKEVEEVNESVRLIVSKGIGDIDAHALELKRRLEVVGNGLKGLKEEEGGLFAEVMAARNEVIETLRRNN